MPILRNLNNLLYNGFGNHLQILFIKRKYCRILKHRHQSLPKKLKTVKLVPNGFLAIVKEIKSIADHINPFGQVKLKSFVSHFWILHYAAKTNTGALAKAIV